MKALGLRAAFTLFGVLVSAVAALVGGYAAVSLWPAAREMRTATAPLLQLYAGLADNGTWVHLALSQASVVERAGAGPEADSTRQALRSLLARRDDLIGTLPLAAVPDSARILLASAMETTSRFVVVLDEFAVLLDLGRRAEARARLAEAMELDYGLRVLLGQAQVRGLDRVLAAERQLDTLSRRMVAAFLLWAIGTAGLVALLLLFVRRRVARPLAELSRGLGRVAEGDLLTELVPVARDELGALAGHFNEMTGVLRARAEAQGQMVAASELLAGVAHEVNNPLMAITGTLEGVLALPCLPDEVRRDLDGVRGEAQRAGRLLQAIVRFTRPRPPTTRPVNVNDVARDAFELIGSQFRSDGIEGAFVLAADLPRVAADAQRLEHVFVSLLANAHQALRRGGRGGGAVSLRTWSEEGRVLAEVVDNGPGVPAEVLPQLFRPFATARPGGHIGLGLYTARMTVRGCGGDLTYEPSEGGGARFVVSLPASGGAVAEAAPEPRGVAAPAPSPRAQEAGASTRTSLQGLSVLVVDDERLVRVGLVRFLTRRGATVREAADGTLALSLLAEAPSDVVVTDLRMPGLDGVGFYRALRAKDPSLASRLLFLSGDVAQLNELDPDEIPPERVLTKPVKLDELERSVLRTARA